MVFQFASISDFFSMGGYGFYVWLSYFVSIFAMAGLIWLSGREQKSILAQVKKTLARDAQRKKDSEEA